jgi:hypothetical protein
VVVLATTNLYACFDLVGVQRGADWVLSSGFTGDNTGVVFTITTAGQVQYTSSNIAGYTSSYCRFRANVLGV